jgi:thiamine biosynthesis lipoprotein
MGRYRFLPPILLVVALLGAVIATNMRTDTDHHADTVIMMDTVVEISVWGDGVVSAQAAVDSALLTIAQVESLFGDGIVNTHADSAVMASPAFVRLVGLSEEVHHLSGGCFDPTIGAVTTLWEFWEGAVPPPADSIAAGLEHVGLERYLAGERDEGLLLDLGGVAKGYAVDQAAATVRRLGFESAIINAGGDLALVGRRPDGEPWRIAIRHPRRKDAFLGRLDLEDAAVATSGDYERYFIYYGRRYHHILDPLTGMPGGRTNSVTVVSGSAGLSDALATGLFLMGPKAGLEAAEALRGVEAVFAYAEGESLALTSGLKTRFAEVSD